MKRTELIDAMAKESGLTKKDASCALDAFVKVLSADLKAGNKTQLSGFGTFETARREARTGKNPATGETITIAASTNAKFKAAKALKDMLNA